MILRSFKASDGRMYTNIRHDNQNCIGEQTPHYGIPPHLDLPLTQVDTIKGK